ncbi:exported hypothetical protein [Nitrospira lenta]|uniref:Uncharacterized protein n=2 Tax=Nitrospira lenta TaxID=1436998 RepID=A0A330L3N9_9BACT|nr:exported hypothetical protein [Nitrospira lenta]
MLVSIALSMLLLFPVPGWTAEGEVFPDLDTSDPVALQEGSRVLEEELKLAARPQTYLLIDLMSGGIYIKARGVDLHRLSITAWTATELSRLTGTFRLTARPPVIRRKIDPSATAEQEPISLSDMPTEYRLSFTPAMTLDIESAEAQGTMGWIHATSRKAWKQLRAWKQQLAETQSPDETPTLSLTLSSEEAQSLAWSTVNGMSVMIRRPSEP